MDWLQQTLITTHWKLTNGLITTPKSRLRHNLYYNSHRYVELIFWIVGSFFPISRFVIVAAIFLLALTFEGCVSDWTWVNDYDKRFRFECPNGQYLTGVQSPFSDYHHDRKFNLRCSPNSSLLHSSCAWTGTIILTFSTDVGDHLINQKRDANIALCSQEHAYFAPQLWWSPLWISGLSGIR